MSSHQRWDATLDRLPQDCHAYGHVDDCQGLAGGSHELMGEPPEPHWEEDEDGFVAAPPSYLNVEGDPTRNGAFR